MKSAEFNCNRCNTNEAYIIEKVRLLRNLHAHWEEPDLVEIIVYGIMERDVRIIASNLNHKRIFELISYIGSIPKCNKGKLKIGIKDAEFRARPRKQLLTFSR